MDKLKIDEAALTAMRALWDEVTPQLRAATVELCDSKKTYNMCIYYEGDASETQLDLWDCVICEASADFNFFYEQLQSITRIDYPSPIPQTGRLVYLRKEPLKSYLAQDPQPEIKVTRVFKSQETDDYLFINPIDLKTYPSSLQLIQTIDGKETYKTARPSSIPKEPYPSSYAILSLQKALLGKVIPELRAVITEVKEGSNHVFVRFFYDTPLIQEILLEWEEALSEVMADFGEGYTFDMALAFLPHPNPIPFQGRYVYLRKGGRYN
jgi:hypothetical protein